MIWSKVTNFPKTHDAGYRSLARVVWACFCYKFSISTTFHFVCVSSYYRALIRIRFAQINQTLHSTILVFIIVVSLHSDAYLRSLTLSHKIGGEQNVRDQYNLAKNVRDQFFSRNNWVLKFLIFFTSTFKKSQKAKRERERLEIQKSVWRHLLYSACNEHRNQATMERWIWRVHWWGGT